MFLLVLHLRDFRWKQGEVECGETIEVVLEDNLDSFTGQVVRTGF